MRSLRLIYAHLSSKISFALAMSSPNAHLVPIYSDERLFLPLLPWPRGRDRVQVVANAVAALSEIGDTSGQDVMEIDTSVLQKLLAALNECTEWGQVNDDDSDDDM